MFRALTERLGEPIALTSANLSGEESSLQISDFNKIWCSLDAIVDGGKIESNHDSQVARAGILLLLLCSR